jgi:flagellar protein FlgJ
MISQANQINTLDPNSLNALKLSAHANTPESIKATATQFEALFMQMMLKAMRETVPKDGATDSEATNFYQGLEDQQLSAVLSQRGGIGLAAALERQLLQQAGLPTDSLTPATISGPAQGLSAIPSRPGTSSSASAQTGSAAGNGDPQHFVDALWSQASDAARSLNVPTHFLVGQAALETGWGKSELRTADGQPTYNLFNIKAGKNWTGPTVDTQTTEYENGVAQTRTERFRVYGSYAEAFQDYANLVQQSPRYAAAVGQGDASSFAKALQSGGYATDPAYADKLTKVINGPTLRQSLLASAR